MSIRSRQYCILMALVGVTLLGYATAALLKANAPDSPKFSLVAPPTSLPDLPIYPSPLKKIDP